MPNDDKGGNMPVGTIFGCLVSFLLGMKMLVMLQRLTEQVCERMKGRGVHGLTRERSLSGINKQSNLFEGVQVNYGCPGPFKGHGTTLMLMCVKFVMFQLSQKICFTIFYFQQFKGNGCYILSRGAASLIISCLIHGGMCFYYGLVLIPLYSLTKHLGIRTHASKDPHTHGHKTTPHHHVQNGHVEIKHNTAAAPRSLGSAMGKYVVPAKPPPSNNNIPSYENEEIDIYSG